MQDIGSFKIINYLDSNQIFDFIEYKPNQVWQLVKIHVSVLQLSFYHFFNVTLFLDIKSKKVFFLL